MKSKKILKLKPYKKGMMIYVGLSKDEWDKLKQCQNILQERTGEKYPLTAICIDALRKFSKPKAVRQWMKEQRENGNR